MTLEKIRQKALELRSKTRWELRKNVAVAVLAVAIASYGIRLAPDPALQAALALAIAWALVGGTFSIGGCGVRRGLADWSRVVPSRD